MSETTADLTTAIAGFESSVANFGIRFIPDSKVRAEYQLKAKLLSQEILKDVNSGKISSFEGAKTASQLRNVLMDLISPLPQPSVSGHEMSTAHYGSRPNQRGAHHGHQCSPVPTRPVDV